MTDNLLTPGEFAKLARTTKRTITFYDEKGILKPFKIEKNGYRLYKPEQIIDFQVLLLLRKLNFSISEIKKYLTKNKSLKNIFEEKRETVEKEILDLRKTLYSIDNFYHNLDATHTLVNPEIKTIKSFEIYFIQRQGLYTKIRDYCLELRSMFKHFPKQATFLTIFEDHGFRPKNANMKIGVIVDPQMQPKTEIAFKKIDSYKALTYKTNGPGSIISLLWRSMDKYMEKNNIQQNLNLYTREIYFDINYDSLGPEDDFDFEIQVPIL